MIELTSEQQCALDAANGSPPVVIDARTQAAYVLVRADDFERLRQAASADRLTTNATAANPSTSCELPEIAEGILRAKAALRRDLPELLANRRTRGKFVCYHLEQRIGINKDDMALIRECNRRNLPDHEYIIEQIEPGAGSIEEIEIESMSNV